MSIATVSDVQTAIGRPLSDPDETARVQWWLDSAELQIRARLGDPALLDPATVRFVEVEAVALRLSNPEGYESEAIDDYRYKLPTETRRVTILPEWWEMLSPTSTGAFSTRPTFEPDSVVPEAWAAP